MGAYSITQITNEKKLEKMNLYNAIPKNIMRYPAIMILYGVQLSGYKMLF